MDIKNFVNDSLFEADNTGLMYITLNRQVASLKLDSLLALPDTTIPPIALINTLNIPGTGPILQPGVPITIFQPSELTFDIPNGVALKRADIRNASMTVKFSNNLTQPLDLIYKIPSATKNGQPFIVSETIPSGTVNAITRTYDLSGYSLDLTGLNHTGFNTIVQSYTMGLSSTATSSLVLMYNEGAMLYVSYSQVVPEYAEGYFGDQIINIKEDTVNLGLSKNFKASNFLLSDATMDFTIINEFGAEFRGNLFNNKSINTANAHMVTLNNSKLTNINIDRATKSGNSINPSSKLISFNSANSNITSFISNLPDKLTYQGNVQVNPLGNISGYNDFAYYNTGIRILANIRIPLRFTADYFELLSNTDVDFANVSQLDKVNYGNFTIIATNGFPFAIKLQGYMYDDQGQVFDSLFVPGSDMLDGGSLNYNNEVTMPTQKKITVPINKTKIEHLRKCKKIKVISRFLMPPNPPDIKILENYQIKVNIVANLNYNVGLSN